MKLLLSYIAGQLEATPETLLAGGSKQPIVPEDFLQADAYAGY